MTRTYAIVLPFEAESINTALRYGAAENEMRFLKQKWQALAKSYLHAAIDNRALPARFRFPIRVSFGMFYKAKALRDEDNVFVVVKAITDAIVRCGLVADDNSEVVSFGGVRFEQDLERPRTVVEIEELAPFAVADDGITIQAYEPHA